MPSASETVAAFIAAIEALDVDAAVALLSDGVSYENVPIQPIVGRGNVHAALSGFLGAASEVEWRVLREVAVGNVVADERIDRFCINGTWIELPVAGFFVIDDDGLIELWRDYFDMATYTNQLAALPAA
jgi:limonene-1,2-epoxide hydrolase